MSIASLHVSTTHQYLPCACAASFGFQVPLTSMAKCYCCRKHTNIIAAYCYVSKAFIVCWMSLQRYFYCSALHCTDSPICVVVLAALFSLLVKGDIVWHPFPFCSTVLLSSSSVAGKAALRFCTRNSASS